MTEKITVSDPRSEAILSAYHQVVVERLEQGLRDIEDKAMEAMREIAIEIWRTSGVQGDDLQHRILASLSKDDAMRGIIQHSDERFQNLALRVGQIEDGILGMSNATRELRSIIVNGSWGAAAGAATLDDETMAVFTGRIDQIETHLEAAFEHLAARDREFFDTVRNQVAQESGKAYAATAQRIQVIEEQLRAGAGAMGELVTAVQEEVARLSEVATREISIDPGQISASVDDGLRRLAALVRSDSQRVAELVQAQADSQRTAIADAIDTRMGRMSELVSATTMAAVNEVARTVPDQAAEALSDRIDEVINAIDRNFVELLDVTETEIHRVGRLIADRSVEKVDQAISAKLDGAVADLRATAASMASASNTASGGASDVDLEAIQAMIDQRVVSLAKMIRADNKSMAQMIQVAAEQQASKQAARAVVELAATLPEQIFATMDRRFGELAETFHKETQATLVAVAKTADVLGRRIDDAANTVNERNTQIGRAVAGMINKQ